MRRRSGTGLRANRRTVSGLIATVVAITLVACGSDNSGPESTGGPPTNPSIPDALRFAAPLVGGGQFEGASVAGKPIAFWFWAPT